MKINMDHLRGYEAKSMSEAGSGRYADGDSRLDQARRSETTMPRQHRDDPENMPSKPDAYQYQGIHLGRS